MTNSDQNEKCTDFALPGPREIAKQGRHLFFPLNSFVKKTDIEYYLNEYGVVWVTSGIGTGKSTLANYLAEQYEDCVLIKSPADPTDYNAWVECIANAHGKEEQPHPQPTDSYSYEKKLDRLLCSFAKKNKLLIFDDGHLVNKNFYLLMRLCKDREPGELSRGSLDFRGH